MNRSIVPVGLLAAFTSFFSALPTAEASAEMRLEISALPALQRYAALLAHPGYVAIVLESNGLTPSHSSKLIVRDRGGTVEARGALLRFVGRNGAVYDYELALVALGSSESRLAFPLSVDTSAIDSGRVVVTLRPPLAALIPDEWKERIQVKAQAIASAAAQRKVVDFLDLLAKDTGGDAAALYETILQDAYNRGSAPAGAGRDVGDALPISDQWLLLLTIFIWAVGLLSLLLVRRLRRGSARPA